jgi:two-component system, chemotaxis family, protein-glutamate methylesterase/glutaminase
VERRQPLPQRDIIVIGGSAGSFDPLRIIISSLPASFPGSVLIVTHMMADFPSLLEEHLSSNSRVPVSQAADQEPIRRGHIYVARPDYHLTVEAGKMRVLRGPRENRHRPAIDPLFRTAARVYGQRVIGIILSGTLEDGSMGLFAVKQRGGIAIVQDPNEAASPEMPRRALGYATPHYVLKARDIVPNLMNLVQVDQDEIVMPKKKAPKTNGQKTNGHSRSPNGGRVRSSAKTAEGTNGGAQPGRGAPITDGDNQSNLKAEYFDEGEGNPSVFACPECHGVLWELQEGNLLQFRCRVGHTYGSDSLVVELSAASEAALWAALRALEEKAAMQRRIADGMSSHLTSAARLRDQSESDEAHARVLREMIFTRDAQLEQGSGSEAEKAA